MESINIKTFLLEEILPTYRHYMDDQIVREYEEDFGKINLRERKMIDRIKRYQNIVNEVKRKYDFTCQICKEKTFLMDSGEHYCEAHHITALSSGGSQGEENIIILCANHHRMFHYAREQINIGDPIDGKRMITINQKNYEISFK